MVDQKTILELINLGLQTAENAAEFVRRLKAASGMTDEQLLEAAGQINGEALSRTKAFLDKLNAE
jgi:hypothetical protein